MTRQVHRLLAVLCSLLLKFRACGVEGLRFEGYFGWRGRPVPAIQPDLGVILFVAGSDPQILRLRESRATVNVP
jgi:hypothetical protein